MFTGGVGDGWFPVCDSRDAFEFPDPFEAVDDRLEPVLNLPRAKSRRAAAAASAAWLVELLQVEECVFTSSWHLPVMQRSGKAPPMACVIILLFKVNHRTPPLLSNRPLMEGSHRKLS